MTLEEFYRREPVAGQLPMVFPNGARWDTFRGTCGSCPHVFEATELRGPVTQPFAGVFVVDAWGYCSECRRLTPFQYRLTEDMGMTGRAPDGGWARWEPKRSGWRSWLRKLGLLSPR